MKNPTRRSLISPDEGSRRRGGRLTAHGYERPLYGDDLLSAPLEEREGCDGEPWFCPPQRTLLDEWGDLGEFEAIPDWWSPRLYKDIRSWRLSERKHVWFVNEVPDLPATELGGSVYYAEKDGLIKVGASRDPVKRCRALCAHLLATEPGFYRKETERHRQFSYMRWRGEWFRPGRELLDHIADLSGSTREVVRQLVVGDEQRRST